jgi:uncharacterized protein YjeT (DUF2065 family)
MKLTKFSLIYLATYLTMGGVGFLFVPTAFSKLLFANPVYQEEPLRMAGMFSLLLGIVVIQIVRHEVSVLYPTSIVARVIGLIALAVLYFQTHNPMFVSLFVIVFLGFSITLFSLIKDKQPIKL